MEKKKCPEVRFNGFNGSWNSKQIENILKIKSGMSQKNIEVEKGKYPILATGGEIGRTNTPIYEKESVLIGRKGTIDKPYYMNSPFWTVDTLFYSELSLDVAGFFVYSLFQRINWRHHNTSTGVPSLTSSVIHAIDVNIPDKVEQTQIGNFFQNLDQSITLHEKKLTQTQNLKKAMLEKMFPKAGSTQPEIRLKGFSGDWALQPLENIFGKIRNAFVGTATPYYVKSGRFYLESNNVKDGKINRKSEIFINDYFYYKQQDKWLKTNDIVMVQSGHVGHAAVITEELNNSAAHALIMFTDYKVDADPHFINYQIQTDNAKNEIDKITTGNTIKHILSSDMKKFSLLFPCVKEQEKIGHFFKQLDETLALQHQQLQTLKNLKQAFLEKMFV